MLAWLLAAAAAPAAQVQPAEPAAVQAPTRLGRKRVRQIRDAIENKRLVQAEAMLGLVAAGAPPEVLVLAGQLRQAQKRPGEALAYFQLAEAQAPDDPLAIGGAGIALLNLGRTAEAETRLRRATELNGKEWRVWNALGIALDRSGDWPGSRAAYAQALRRAPKEATIYNNLGYSLLLQRRIEAARAALNHARTLDPDDAGIITNLQLADGMAGQTPLREATEAPRAWAGRLNTAGYAAMLAGDLARARSLFSQAIAASDTRYERAERNLARVEKASSR